MGAKFKLCALVASKSRDFSRRSAWYAIAGLISKIGDIKVNSTGYLELFTTKVTKSLEYLEIVRSEKKWEIHFLGQSQKLKFSPKIKFLSNF